MKKLLIVLFFFISWMLLAGSQGDVVKKRFDVDPGKQAVVDFKDIDGNVVVEKHNKNEIAFEFVKELKSSRSERNLEYFAEIHPDIDYNNNRLTIVIKYPSRSFKIFGSTPRVRIRSKLLVPVNTDAKIRTIDGNIAVSGLQGDHNIRSTDGNVTVDDCKGKIMLKTTDGNIEASALNGEIEAESTDGDLDIKKYEGSLKCYTTDGNIDVDKGAGSLHTRTTDGDVKASGIFTSLHFKSSDGNGRFYFREGSTLKDDCYFRTTDGDIGLTIPDGFSCKLDLKSGDGNIRVNDLQLKNVSIMKKNRLEAETGEGGHKIEINTGDGNISLQYE